MNTPEREVLRAFRQHVYPLFGCRRDALFAALDAVLSAPTLDTPAHLSLVPTCHRRWGSRYEALNAGRMDLARLERLAASYPLEEVDPLWWTPVRLGVKAPRRCSHVEASATLSAGVS